MQIIKLMDSEVADLIMALEAAQGELCCGPNFPEGSAQWERWEELIQRFRRGATTPGQG